jgi:hypothetical protein
VTRGFKSESPSRPGGTVAGKFRAPRARGIIHEVERRGRASLSLSHESRYHDSLTGHWHVCHVTVWPRHGPDLRLRVSLPRLAPAASEAPRLDRDGCRSLTRLGRAPGAGPRPGPGLGLEGTEPNFCPSMVSSDAFCIH